MAVATDIELLNRIVCDPAILRGKPILRGTRFSVAFILECLAGMTKEELLRDYPSLTEDDIRAALLYAARVMHQERALR